MGPMVKVWVRSGRNARYARHPPINSVATRYPTKRSCSLLLTNSFLFFLPLCCDTFSPTQSVLCRLFILHPVDRGVKGNGGEIRIGHSSVFFSCWIRPFLPLSRVTRRFHLTWNPTRVCLSPARPYQESSQSFLFFSLFLMHKTPVTSVRNEKGSKENRSVIFSWTIFL